MIAGSATKAGLMLAADRVLVSDVSGARTGSDIDAAVDRLAAQLDRGVPRGGSVGIWAWNSAELVVAHLAAERAGVTRIPVDPEAPSREVEAIMAKADVTTVITDDEHVADWATTQIRLSADLWSGNAVVRFDGVRVEESAPAIRIVRGIVSGELLAIPLSFANWEAHMALAEQLFESGAYGTMPTDELRFLTTQQLQYGTGLVGSFAFIRMGCPQVIVRKFDPELVVAAVGEHGASVTFMVPGMITRLADHLRGRRPAAWELQILYGGAPFPLEEMLAAMDVLGSSMTQLYGRFEGGWPITILGSDEHAEIAKGDDALAKSCGRQVPSVQLDLRVLSGNGSTELRVKSDCVSAAFADPDGWCALGDVATIDQDGYLYLQGRVDGMINTGSFHVYPDEVETAARAEFPGLKSVTVSARPDERWGQAVCAEMSWRSEADIPGGAEFRSRMSSRLAKYKVPTICVHDVEGRVVRPDEGASV